MSKALNEALEKGLVLEEFKEAEEVATIIDSLVNIYGDQIAVELAVERFLFVIDQYQEQPHLLDHHLEKLLNQLLNIVRNRDNPRDVYNLAFKLLYFITKTRGFKVVLRLMPHEVADLEPVLALLNEQDPKDFQCWETRYMLLLWLSMVCMIPFDMCRLDSNTKQQGQDVRKPIMERIIDICTLYLDVSDKSRDAAAYTLSRFMTRPDVKKAKLPEFVDWCFVTMNKADKTRMSGMSTISGVLSTLALLFKVGKRDDLLEYAPIILEHLTKLNLDECKSPLMKKMSTKLIQRIGLTFLKATVATWRYQRGSRFLAKNLSSEPASKILKTQDKEEEEEVYEIPDEIEEVLEYLLNSLKDKDTIVRWSAAKGIGRVTGRLPQELADEVVASIMELFTITETDSAWHGGCLALAELGRRGYLLPDRLPEVVPVVIKALRFDEKRGNFSVGAHVRDAACYVCWAFARAYDPDDVKPYVNQIANALVIAFIFDREINVRRAASAAFQENVGRQGQFPHGIDILTTCDYFAVSMLFDCYYKLSVYVAQFEEYTKSMIDHLVEVKSNHWSLLTRKYSAKALGLLTPKAVNYMAESVVPSLLEKCLSKELNQRHGAITAVSRVTLALANLEEGPHRPVEEMLGATSVEAMSNITMKLHEAKLFRGMGGEMMRISVCCMIENLSKARLHFTDPNIMEVWHSMLDECIEHKEPEIQYAAVKALPEFVSEYYCDKNRIADPKAQDLVIGKCLTELNNQAENIRMGHAQALGSLPKNFLQGKLTVVMAGLMALSRPEKDTKMVQARRDAVTAITSVCKTVGISRGGDVDSVLCEANIPDVFQALFTALGDYTVDSRGDVGSWVREVAMTGLFELTSMILKDGLEDLITPHISHQLFASLIQQACEKIDRTRGVAGENFFKLLYHNPEVPHVCHREELKAIWIQEEYASVNWAFPSVTFPQFIRLLSLPRYSYHVLLGVTVSVGGLTESLVKSASASLMEYLQPICSNREQLDEFSAVLLKLFRNLQKVDRVTLPMFKMLDQMLNSGCFILYEDDSSSTFAVDLFDLCKTEITRCGDMQKLLASVEVFCDLLVFTGTTRKKTISQLMLFLCHKYPIIRKAVGFKLYESLLAFEDLVSEDILDQVMTILSETQWDQPVPEIRPIRAQLCELLEVKTPVTLKPKEPTSN